MRKPSSATGDTGIVCFCLAPIPRRVGSLAICTCVRHRAGRNTGRFPTIEPAVFADQLLLCVRKGRYGDQFKNEWLLFAHDGKNTRRVPLECDRIVDTLVKDDRLILLLARQGKHVLAESTDLAHWSRRALGPEIERPLSVECDGNAYYLGLADGTVLAATASAN
ncbi:MAG: hypothetical protein HQ582_12085 [Planctomycetes bacterium]|nr:hypothetical protein [Planctomycetota bacterium]